MSKHTPGPWELQEHDPAPRTMLADIVQSAEFGIVVAADVDILNPADARLMVAAPDLLDALEKIASLDAAPDGFVDEWTQAAAFSSAQEIARTALAKVEG